MKAPINRNVQAVQQPAAAFSLIEIMVTVGLLSLIILGLLATFNQTQRAFRTSMTQTDVLEAGRAVTDMMVREIEQMSASHLPYTTNFFAAIPSTFNEPLFQGLPGTRTPSGAQDRRTNVVQQFFLLSRFNTKWLGIGYHVVPSYPNAGVGALYRYERETTKDYAWYLADDFQRARLTNMARIADGVVHLRLRAFDKLGRLITPTNEVRFASNWWSGLPRLENEINYYYFASNALPATVELELGILEGPVLQRYRAFEGNPTVQWEYLSNNAASVHLFRQRIPVRNVDLSAYP